MTNPSKEKIEKLLQRLLGTLEKKFINYDYRKNKTFQYEISQEVEAQIQSLNVDELSYYKTIFQDFLSDLNLEEEKQEQIKF